MKSGSSWVRIPVTFKAVTEKRVKEKFSRSQQGLKFLLTDFRNVKFYVDHFLSFPSPWDSNSCLATTFFLFFPQEAGIGLEFFFEFGETEPGLGWIDSMA